MCSNHCCVHGRTAFQDGGDGGGDVRHMLRLWLTLPPEVGRPLPPHYAETREYGDTYARRCVVPPSTNTLVVPPVLAAVGAGLAFGQQRYGLLDKPMHTSVETVLWWALWLPVVYWMQLGAGWFLRSQCWRITTTPLPVQMISWRNFFLLCYSESFSMIAVALILWHTEQIGAWAAVGLGNGINLIGYSKYIYQMFFDPEYITLSFHCYCLAWLSVSLGCADPVYFVLFRYPFHLVGQIESYMNMRGRKVLFDEASITIHCVDHILHGIISLRVLLYHFYGTGAILLDVVTIPFVLLMSENLVRMQDPAQRHKLR